MTSKASEGVRSDLVYLDKIYFLPSKSLHQQDFCLSHPPGPPYNMKTQTNKENSATGARNGHFNKFIFLFRISQLKNNKHCITATCNTIYRVFKRKYHRKLKEYTSNLG